MQGVTNQNFVPTVAVRAAAVPAIAPIVALYPLPTVVAPGATSGYLFQTSNQIAQEDYFLARVDYVISDKDTLFVRYLSDRAI